MVHLVSERPRDALLPVLIEHCCGPARAGGARPTGLKREPWWRTVFPVYYELFYLGCNAFFLVGSVLFLPIFEERRLSVNFSMTVLNVDKGELLSSNRTLLDAFQGNILSSVAEQAGPLIRPEHAHLVWHATKSCKLNDAIILDMTILPPWFANVTDVQERLRSSPSSLAAAVNRSIGMVSEIQSITTGTTSVQMLNKPVVKVNADAESGNGWAIDLGCDLYILGSLLMALLTVYDLLEDFLACCVRRSSDGGGGNLRASSGRSSCRQSDGESPVTRSPASRRTTFSLSYFFDDGDTPKDAEEKREKKKETEHARVNVAEKALYFFGAFVFLIGTFYFQHPKKVAASVPSVEEKDVLNMAIAMFIGGSATFVFAAFLNALSLTTNGSTFSSWAVAVCGIYECGGILFVVGSVCFMPNQGCGKGMEVMGAWCFIIGSCCYILGGCLEVVKTVALLFLKKQQEEAAKKIAQAYSGVLLRRRQHSLATLSSSVVGQLPSSPPLQEPSKDDSDSTSGSSRQEDELEERLLEQHHGVEDVDLLPAEVPAGPEQHEAAEREASDRAPSHRSGELPRVPSHRSGELRSQRSGELRSHRSEELQEPEQEAPRRYCSEGPMLPPLSPLHLREDRMGRCYTDLSHSSRRALSHGRRERAATEEAELVAGAPGLWSTFFRAMAVKEQLLRRRLSAERPLGDVELPLVGPQAGAMSSARYSDSDVALGMRPL